ncbi:uncharacterized protein TRUGW13939_08552 [Talaromyces rugulosus]|uniref:Pectate lyase superfamily protein domain-containing protein n=1 Tax=Talaromyces rugulosus TaxID=121627 RepID=A0A7H8R4U1_TALRU|nr:uncharacterized protein TRUGW13939_08552 [Talaromyces rugulosus]QKX61404.1 hypothetical protein TRUGW13939_08552 [Talaromyces rugulosus]
MWVQFIPFLFALWAALVTANITTYPPPSIYGVSSVYELSVNGVPVPAVAYPGYDYAQLSMDEDQNTKFAVTIKNGTAIDSYSITPKSLDIKASVSGDTLSFSVTKAYYLILKVNGQKEFVIVADPNETDVPPSSGQGIYNVMDYQADNTGTSLTSGVQDALNAAGKASGGIVYVPKGIFLVGNIIIPSRTSLYLAGGSVLRFTGNPADYNQLYNKPGLGPGTWWIQTAINSTDCKIYGRGTIDANGYGYQQGKHVAQVIVPVGTKRFIADGPLIRESSFWTIVPTQSEDVQLLNLKILNRLDMVQNDGIDAVECKGVETRRVIAIANDDSFSAKTWPYDADDIFSAYPYSPLPQSNISFTDCVAWTHCYGFKVGQGVYQYQENIVFEDGTVYKGAVGIGIDHKYGDGVARNVTWRNIVIEGLGYTNLPGVSTWLAILVELDGKSVGPIENLLMEDIRIYDLGKTSAPIKGYNSSVLVTNTNLNNIYLNDDTTPTTNMSALKILHMHTLDTTLTATSSSALTG